MSFYLKILGFIYFFYLTILSANAVLDGIDLAEKTIENSYSRDEYLLNYQARVIKDGYKPEDRFQIIAGALYGLSWFDSDLFVAPTYKKWNQIYTSFETKFHFIEKNKKKVHSNAIMNDLNGVQKIVDEKLKEYPAEIIMNRLKDLDDNFLNVSAKIFGGAFGYSKKIADSPQQDRMVEAVIYNGIKIGKRNKAIADAELAKKILDLYVSDKTNYDDPLIKNHIHKSVIYTFLAAKRAASANNFPVNPMPQFPKTLNDYKNLGFKIQTFIECNSGKKGANKIAEPIGAVYEKLNPTIIKEELEISVGLKKLIDEKGKEFKPILLSEEEAKDPVKLRHNLYANLKQLKDMFNGKYSELNYLIETIGLSTDAKFREQEIKDAIENLNFKDGKWTFANALNEVTKDIQKKGFDLMRQEMGDFINAPNYQNPPILFEGGNDEGWPSFDGYGNNPKPVLTEDEENVVIANCVAQFLDGYDYLVKAYGILRENPFLFRSFFNNGFVTAWACVNARNIAVRNWYEENKVFMSSMDDESILAKAAYNLFEKKTISQKEKWHSDKRIEALYPLCRSIIIDTYLKKLGNRAFMISHIPEHELAQIDDIKKQLSLDAMAQWIMKVYNAHAKKNGNSAITKEEVLNCIKKLQ